MKQILKNLDLSKDATNPEKQNIIDLLIHRIYLWQDKILIVFNQSNLCDNEISVDDTDVNTIIKTLSEPNASSSDSVEYGTPYLLISEFLQLYMYKNIAYQIFTIQQ